MKLPLSLGSALLLALVCWGDTPPTFRPDVGTVFPRGAAAAVSPPVPPVDVILWSDLLSNNAGCTNSPYTPETGNNLTVSYSGNVYYFTNITSVAQATASQFCWAGETGMVNGLPEATNWQYSSQAFDNSSGCGDSSLPWYGCYQTIQANTQWAPDNTQTADLVQQSEHGEILYLYTGDPAESNPSITPPGEPNGCSFKVWAKRSNLNTVATVLPVSTLSEWVFDTGDFNTGWELLTEANPAVTVNAPMQCDTTNVYDCSSPTCTSNCGLPECFLYVGTQQIVQRMTLDWEPYDGNYKNVILWEALTSDTTSAMPFPPITTTGAAIATRPSTAGTITQELLGTAGAGSFQFIPLESTGWYYQGDPTTGHPMLAGGSVFLLEIGTSALWSGTTRLNPTVWFRLTVNDQTVTLDTQGNLVKETPITVKWKYEVGSPACLKVNDSSDVCSSGNVSAFTDPGEVVLTSVPGWTRNLQFCSTYADCVL